MRQLKKTRCWTIILLGLCITLSGCGTVLSVAEHFDDEIPNKKDLRLTATRTDFYYMKELVDDCFTTTYNENYVACPLMPVPFVDLPFALALDVVTLPYDWYKNSRRTDYVRKETAH